MRGILCLFFSVLIVGLEFMRGVVKLRWKLEERKVNGLISNRAEIRTVNLQLQ